MRLADEQSPFGYWAASECVAMLGAESDEAQAASKRSTACDSVLP